jgi:hypothetical protein
MGRVFTIMFDFRDERHVAVVTVCNQQPEDPVYYVRLFNPDLQKIVPGARIRFSPTDHSVPNSLQDPKAKELFLGIKDAIFGYLKENPTVEEATLNKVHHDELTNKTTS